MSLTIIYFIIALTGLTIWLIYIGIFNKPSITTIRLPFHRVALYDYTGSYSKFLKKALKTRIRFTKVVGVDRRILIGAFFDDPAVTKRCDRRYSIGYSIDHCTDEEIEKLKEAGFHIVRFNNEEVFGIQLPLRSFFGSLINIVKAYKYYNQNVDSKNIVANAPVVETYNLETRTHNFLLPINEQLFSLDLA